MFFKWLLAFNIIIKVFLWDNLAQYRLPKHRDKVKRFDLRHTMFDLPYLLVQLIGYLISALVRDRSPEVFLMSKDDLLVKHKVLSPSLVDRVDQIWKYCWYVLPYNLYGGLAWRFDSGVEFILDFLRNVVVFNHHECLLVAVVIVDEGVIGSD